LKFGIKDILIIYFTWGYTHTFHTPGWVSCTGETLAGGYFGLSKQQR